MKTNTTEDQTQINIRVNTKEYELVKELREKYAINMSGAFKIFLRELKEKLERK